jgi:hypothetical protein
MSEHCTSHIDLRKKSMWRGNAQDVKHDRTPTALFRLIIYSWISKNHNPHKYINEHILKILNPGTCLF